MGESYMVHFGSVSLTMEPWYYCSMQLCRFLHHCSPLRQQWIKQIWRHLYNFCLYVVNSDSFVFSIPFSAALFTRRWTFLVSNLNLLVVITSPPSGLPMKFLNCAGRRCFPPFSISSCRNALISCSLHISHYCSVIPSSWSCSFTLS